MRMANPFSLVKASDYTNQQVNTLWVDALDKNIIDTIIQPTQLLSQFILGGKGSGKTHLIRYHSYQVARLRYNDLSGVELLKKLGFLGVFLRVTSLDSDRFEFLSKNKFKWQNLFGLYLDLRLMDILVSSLIDIAKTSEMDDVEFNDSAFLDIVKSIVIDESITNINNLFDFKDWLIKSRREIDQAINNIAYSPNENLNINLPYSMGALCLKVKDLLSAWNEDLANIPVFYFIDEVENLSKLQQEVLNSFIRYTEGQVSFRITGRLYALKSSSTVDNREINIEGSEFKTVYLENLLYKFKEEYKVFSKEFITKRIISNFPNLTNNFQIENKLEFIDKSNFYNNTLMVLGLDKDKDIFFEEKYKIIFQNFNKEHAKLIINYLFDDSFPILLKRLNFILFCKKYNLNNYIEVAKKIHEDTILYMNDESDSEQYETSYHHWGNDLFAQVCRESKKYLQVPYGGFDQLVRMTSCNPRNLLVIFNKIYEYMAFNNISFESQEPISLVLQTSAAIEASKFFFEQDSNYGSSNESSRVAIHRMASLLKSARFSQNIPEVSPLTISFTEHNISSYAKETIKEALNYSLIFKVEGGRPDRNRSELNNTKIQLNPILSPLWGLPTVRRGDIALSIDMVEAIFGNSTYQDFDDKLKIMASKWDKPFIASLKQEDLF